MPERRRSGPLRFARYAYPPNQLGYCGGPDRQALVDHCREAVDDRELVALCRDFEGAWPYLQLIAESGGTADPLDADVVEAYWIGNDLLAGVPARTFEDSLRSRFRSRTTSREWPSLAAKPSEGAQPHHSFHVLELFPRIGLLRDGRVNDLVERMEQCLIRPAEVEAVDGQDLLVLAQPLEVRDGRIGFGRRRPERLRRPVTGPGERSPGVGDWVTAHWGWACEQIGRRELANLEAATRHSLEVANRTFQPGQRAPQVRAPRLSRASSADATL